MAPLINILAPELVNKISAGEVVERPASVVKELIENSLDANAARILIEVSGGGRELIRVTDNGQGMVKEDLLLSCRSHATSKIKNAGDLEHITTLGFRGEALASIAAVCRMEIRSCATGSREGNILIIEGGVEKEIRGAGMPHGTTVEARQLFYNVPARLKFLKSIPTEMGHITTLVSKHALAFHEVDFRLVSENREVIQSPPCRDLKERIGLLFGEEVVKELIPFSGQEGSWTIKGFLTGPAYTRPNREMLLFYVNRRHVESKLLSHAVMAGYHTMLQSQRYPAVFLFLEIDPSMVDVNVHPAKREVRFSQEKRLHDMVAVLIQKTLRKSYLTYESAAPPAQSDLLREPPFVFPESMSAGGKKGDTPFPIKDFSAFTPEKTFMSQDLFQAGGVYLVTHDEKGIIILDQHAAHERILYEDFMKKFKAGQIETQNLLFPVTVELSPAETEFLKGHIAQFNSIGLDMEEFGRNTFVLNNLPATFQDLDAKVFIKGILSELQQEGLSDNTAKNTEEKIILAACRTAVKAKDRLPHEEFRALYPELMRTDSPATCPHGRPTFFRITWDELAKKFRRK